MIRKVSLMMLIFILLLCTACSSNTPLNNVGIDITWSMASIGPVEGNANDLETQSFKYSVIITNNEAIDITIVEIMPLLSEKFLERVSNKDTMIKVNKTISKGSSLEVSGEIIFDARGLTKEQIHSLQPFVKEVKIIEERNINKSFWAFSLLYCIFCRRSKK